LNQLLEDEVRTLQLGAQPARLDDDLEGEDDSGSNENVRRIVPGDVRAITPSPCIHAQKQISMHTLTDSERERTMHTHAHTLTVVDLCAHARLLLAINSHWSHGGGLDGVHSRTRCASRARALVRRVALHKRRV
jgi:hypothetical protein